MSDPKRCGAEPTDAELDRLAQALEDAVAMVREIANDPNTDGRDCFANEPADIARAKRIIEIIDAAAARG